MRFFTAANLIVVTALTTCASLVIVDPVNAQEPSKTENGIIALADRTAAAYDAGKIDEALQLSDQLLKEAKAKHGSQSMEYFQFLSLRSAMLRPLNRMDEHAALLVELVPLARKLIDNQSPQFIKELIQYSALLGLLGRFADAAPVQQEIVQLLKLRSGALDPDTLQAQSDLAANLTDRGLLADAEQLSKEVLENQRAVLGLKHDSVLRSLQQYGQIKGQLGKFDEAKGIFAELLILHEELSGKSHPRTGAIVNNLAQIMQAQGRFGEAEPLFARALRIAQESYGEDDDVTLITLSSYASILRSLKRMDEAEALYVKIFELEQKIHGAEHPQTLITQSNLAAILFEQGKLKEAEPVLAKTLQLQRKLLGENHPNTISSLQNYAALLDSLGRVKAAEVSYLEAIEKMEMVLGKQHPGILPIRNNLGLFYLNNGQPFKGAAMLVDSFELSKELRGDNHMETIRIAANIANILLLGDTGEQAYGMALFAADGIRNRRLRLGSDVRSQARLQDQQKKQRSYFEDLMDAAWMARSTNMSRDDEMKAAAFQASQDILTGTTSRAVARSAARRAAQQKGLGDIARKRQDLADNWMEIESEITNSLLDVSVQSGSKREALRKRLSDIEKQIDQLDTQLKRAPEYLALVRPKALPNSEATELFESDEAGLILVPTELGTHIMLITNDEIQWYRSDWTKDKIEAAVTRLLWDVGGNVDVANGQSVIWEEEGEGVYPYDLKTAHALYRELIGPVAPHLNGKTHLFVMSAGSLSNLPLGMLVSSVPDGANGDPAVLRSAPWLADQYALVQIPNLQSIHFLRTYRTQKSNKKRRPFLGFGDPVLEGNALDRGSRSRTDRKTDTGFSGLFDGQTRRNGDGIVNVDELKKLARLPGTATELEAMWEAFGKPKNSLFLNKAATESNIQKANLNAEVISFATHGLLAGEIGGLAEPGLVLTPPDQATDTDDGYLSMSEIAALKLDSDWVILSACNTAGGDGSNGASGMSGLARSFFYAGARNLMASHWPVRDDVAAKLTVRTITIANDNPQLSRAEAFQLAMREIRNDESADSDNDTWAHPAAWAPFSLIGDRAN